MGTLGPNPTSVKGSWAPPWTWGWQQCPKVIYNVHYQPHQWVEDQTARKHCDITESLLVAMSVLSLPHSDADKCIKKLEAKCPLVWPIWSEVVWESLLRAQAAWWCFAASWHISWLLIKVSSFCNRTCHSRPWSKWWWSILSLSQHNL